MQSFAIHCSWKRRRTLFDRLKVSSLASTRASRGAFWWRNIWCCRRINTSRYFPCAVACKGERELRWVFFIILMASSALRPFLPFVVIIIMLHVLSSVPVSSAPYEACSQVFISFLYCGKLQQLLGVKAESIGSRGTSEFRTGVLKMDIPFSLSKEDMGYRWWLVALLADRRCDKSVPTVPDIAFSWLDRDWSQLWLVVKRQY